MCFEACGPRGWTVESEGRNRVTHSRKQRVRFSMYPLFPILAASGIHLFSCDTWLAFDFFSFFKKYFWPMPTTPHRFTFIFFRFLFFQRFFNITLFLTKLELALRLYSWLKHKHVCQNLTLLCRHYPLDWLMTGASGPWRSMLDCYKMHDSIHVGKPESKRTKTQEFLANNVGDIGHLDFLKKDSRNS